MQQKFTVIFGLLIVNALIAEARPFFYYQAEAPETAVASIQKDAESAADGAKKFVDQVGQQARQAGNYIQGAINNSPSASGISTHLGSLYEHGSSAMRTVMETVRPDINNIGHDITEFAKETRDNVSKKITPLGQTIKPYIDHAQKVVAPYVNQAKEEMPKLIERAGPTLNKARDTLSSAWDKLSSSVSTAANQMSSQAHTSAQQSSEAIQQAASEAGAAVAPAPSR